MKDYVQYFWVLKRCVWCDKHILPDDVSHTVDVETDGGVLWFQHRNGCPEVDPLLALQS